MYIRIQTTILVANTVAAIHFLSFSCINWNINNNINGVNLVKTKQDYVSILPANQNFSKDKSRPECNMLPFNSGPIMIVWAWDHPPNREAMKATIDNAASAIPRTQINIYCGSTACVEAARLSNALCVHVEIMVAPLMAQGSPLEDWVSDHILAKLLSVHHYEDALQVAMQLIALWTHGGLLLSIGSKLSQENISPSYLSSSGKGLLLFTDSNGNIARQGIGGGLHGVLASKRHTIIIALMTEMLKAYHWSDPNGPPYVSANWPVQLNRTKLCDQSNGCRNATVNMSGGGVLTIDLKSSVIDKGFPSRHFGTLSYQARRSYLKSMLNYGMNIGDEMQGLAGIQFIPRIDAFVERDRLDVVNVIASKNFSTTCKVNSTSAARPAQVPTTVFFNAWWGTKTWVWPPPGQLEPIFVAMHLNSKKVQDDVASYKEYLSLHSPIGARDTATDAFFQSQNITSMFSGCMTMTLLSSWSAERTQRERTDEILVVDVSERAMKELPADIQTKAIRMTVKLLNETNEGIDDQVARYIAAHTSKLRFQRAKLVITQRLHVALPSASMGTPVILLMDSSLPGGGGAAGLARFSGLQAAVHTIEVSNSSAGLVNFNWQKPPPNPNYRVLEVHRHILRSLIMCHGERIVFDSARKFGLIPSTWEYPRENNVCESNNQIEDEKRRTVHLATSVTANWFNHHPVFSSWIHSLSASNIGVRFIFYFLTGEMTAKQRCLLRWIVKQWIPDSVVYTIPMDKILNNLKYKGLAHVPKITQARLYLPLLLPCVRRLLWIDLDAFVIRNVQQLWDEWQEKKMPICGIVARTSAQRNVIHGMIMTELKLNISTDNWIGQGFNAGVMIMDLDILRASNFIEKRAAYWSFASGGNDQISLNM